MRWPKVVIGEVEYDLSHLDPFIIDVTPKNLGAPTYRVRVSFGCHTFTRALAATDPEDHIFRDGAEERCFCPIRHEHSRHLPQILQAGIARAYFWDHGRFLIGHEIQGLSHPYAIIFNMEKLKQGTADVGMFILTAFEKDDMPKRGSAISFATLVSKKVKGEYLTRPLARPVRWKKK